MVHIKDEGSHFDEPIDVVWKYVQAREHGAAHTGSRNQKMEMAGDNVVIIDEEQEMGGKWVKTKTKITNVAPVGMTIEMLEGPMAGSKFFNYYTPAGQKTGVSVVGEFTGAGMPEHAVRGAVEAWLTQAFNEDNAAMKAFAGKK